VYAGGMDVDYSVGDLVREEDRLSMTQNVKIGLTTAAIIMAMVVARPAWFPNVYCRFR
jgi:hypothetical protein